MSLDRLRQTWEGLGRDDALWAVLSDPAKTNNRWDPGEFFESGKLEIAALFGDLDQRALTMERRQCLDFGCGVGRLTQSLCSYFDLVDGVDIAQSMIDRAMQYNQHGDRCRYHVNARDDLGLFDEATFDFVYSTIVLQHMEPELAERYISEFVRVLAPGGLAVFQVPSRFLGIPPLPPDSHQADIGLEGAPGQLRIGTGGKSVLRVRVRNLSSAPWHTAASIRVGNHWLRHDSSMLVLDDGRTPLPWDLGPGEVLTLEIMVTAPTTPGSYVLELDLVEEGVTWFAFRGSQTCRVDVEVFAPPKWQTLTESVRRALRSPGVVGDQVEDSAPPFEMHAVPKARIVEVVTGAGAEVVAIEDCDVSGPGWENFRYFVRKS